jgi:hypothetical protein
MTNEKGEGRRFGPGDMGFFPTGTTCIWTHPHHFRKVAVLKESLLRLLGSYFKVWAEASPGYRVQRRLTSDADTLRSDLLTKLVTGRLVASGIGPKKYRLDQT